MLSNIENITQLVWVCNEIRPRQNVKEDKGGENGEKQQKWKTKKNIDGGDK